MARMKRTYRNPSEKIAEIILPSQIPIPPTSPKLPNKKLFKVITGLSNAQIKADRKAKRQSRKEDLKEFYKTDLKKMGVAEACAESILNVIPPVVINKIQSAINNPKKLSKRDLLKVRKVLDMGVNPDEQENAVECAIKNKQNKILTRKSEYSKLYKDYLNRYKEFGRKRQKK